MGRPNGAARAEVEGDKCAGSGDPIGSGNERPVPRWKPHGSGRTESHRWLGFQSPSLDPVTAARPSFLQAARLSALAHERRLWPRSFHDPKKKKEKSKRGKQFCNPAN